MPFKKRGLPVRRCDGCIDFGKSERTAEMVVEPLFNDLNSEVKTDRML